MKYETEITIDLPRARVIELFDDSDNLLRWQFGLQGYEYLDGEPGQPGSRMKLIYKEGESTVELIETIVERDFPYTFAATYEAKNLYNLVRNRFIDEGPDRTRWLTENEFRFKGVMALVGLFLKSAFPTQTLRDMNRFKAFAESA